MKQFASHQKLQQRSIKIISGADSQKVSAGLSPGIATMGLVAGFISGGPVGLGVAACGMVGAQGIDGLLRLYR